MSSWGQFLLPGMNSFIPSTNPKQPAFQESSESKKDKKKAVRRLLFENGLLYCCRLQYPILFPRSRPQDNHPSLLPRYPEHSPAHLYQ